MSDKRNNNGEKIKNVKWLNSYDVDKYFKEQNRLYKRTDNARFDEYFKIDKNDKPYYLVLYRNGINIKEIPLTEINGEDDKLKIKWNFDEVSIHENKMTITEGKVILLQNMAKIYTVFNEIFTYFALLIYLFLIVILLKNNINKKEYSMFIILSVLLGVFLLRIFTISYNTVTAFNSVSYGYLSPCYPILAAFNGLCLVYGIELLKRLRKEN